MKDNELNAGESLTQQGPFPNRVELVGKVTKAFGLRYTPSGIPLFEFVLATSQTAFQKKNIGYFGVQLIGSLAEDFEKQIRIGEKISVIGSLWMRNYRNRQRQIQTETKIVAEEIKVLAKEKFDRKNRRMHEKG